jgi:hypothetical protein
LGENWTRHQLKVYWLLTPKCLKAKNVECKIDAISTNLIVSKYIVGLVITSQLFQSHIDQMQEL